MLDQTDGEITLVGTRGQVILLSSPGTPAREGISLREVPPGLSETSRDHKFDTATGEHRGVIRSTSELRLDLQARGEYPREYVHELVEALGTGEKPVRIVVTSPEMGTRWKEYYLREVSSVRWHGHPMYSPLAQFVVLLEAGRPGWTREPQRVTLRHDSEFGWVTLPVSGDMDVWPRFTITGVFTSVSVRLREQDEIQDLPYSADGWAINSRPDRRVVSTVSGEQNFQGVVPFWPEPAENEGGRARVEVLVDSPGPDFEMVIEYTPEATRAW